MKVDAMLRTAPRDAGPSAARLEAAGYDAAWSTETDHDPFLPLVAAAGHTRTIGLGTAVAVAFARNPMNLAQIGWDLQAYSGGRTTLGFGSQIRAHITRRFSMPWGRPAARMRETVLAIRSIWDAWLHDHELDFRGEFFTHTLMTPLMTPPADDVAAVGLPEIFVAAVGPRMTEVAAEVADGMITHSFHTARYLDEAILPVVHRHATTRGPCTVMGAVLVASGVDDEQTEVAREAVRGRIAFYASTPAYRPVLETHGWGELHTELHTLSKQGRWAEMTRLVGDDLLDEVAVVRAPDGVAAELAARYDGRLQRLSFDTPYPSDPEMWASIAGDLRALTTRSVPR